MPDNLSGDLSALRPLLAQMQPKAVHLKEKNPLLRQRLFARKSEQIVHPVTPQLALFNEAKSFAEPATKENEEAVIASAKQRGKREPTPFDLLPIEVIHELPVHELTGTSGCGKQIIGEETSEQLEIVPIQIREISHRFPSIKYGFLGRLLSIGQSLQLLSTSKVSDQQRRND